MAEQLIARNTAPTIVPDHNGHDYADAGMSLSLVAGTEGLDPSVLQTERAPLQPTELLEVGHVAIGESERHDAVEHVAHDAGLMVVMAETSMRTPSLRQGRDRLVADTKEKLVPERVAPPVY